MVEGTRCTFHLQTTNHEPRTKNQYDHGAEVEEIEVEVTDDENNCAGPVTPVKSSAPQQKVAQGKKAVYAVDAPPISTKEQAAPVGKTATPGKVTPSNKVKNHGWK